MRAVDTRTVDSTSEMLINPSASLSTRSERLRKELEGRLALIRLISGILAIIVFLATGLGLAGSLTSPEGFSFSLPLLISLASGLYFLLCAGLAGKNSSLNRTVTLSYMMIVGLAVILVALCLSVGLQDSLPAGFIMIPVIAGIFSLSTREVTLISIASAVLLFLMFLLNGPGKNVIATAINWEFSYLVITVGITAFTRRLNVTKLNLEEQTERLSHLYGALNSTNQFGAALSRSLSGVTAELNATSRQQASSTQEQVSAVTEVTSSLEELSETANQIAASAASASQAARQTVTIASEVRNASEVAQITTERGDQAVEEAISSVERVRNRIELLGQRLLHLTEQTRRVGSIIDIIDEIADETHLLALNASIEAAGGTTVGDNSGGAGRSSVRGERFGVIAQEVKNLSDRSRESTEEVRQAITEMQGAVAAAVLVAEEGKKETAAALSRSQIAGTVIEKLNEVISNSASRAEEILEAVEEVKIRCDEISIATGQQRSANQQILITMRGVAQVSQESAGAVVELSNTVERVNLQLDQLNQVLDNSNRSAQLVLPVA